MQQWISDKLCEFISIRSISGTEQRAIGYLESLFQSLDWDYELFPVDADRSNIFVSFGKPSIVFTTHVDVVPAPDALFEPRVAEGIIYGRGANDAKGIVIAMIAAARTLLDQGKRDFGLLFVLEEETTGRGARAAAQSLQGRGVTYLVNGEPTENTLAIAHKGGYGVYLSTSGESCHSGYPELGKDAIAPLIEICHDLLHTDFGSDEVLGKATLNIGTIRGGSASNVVPDAAGCDVLIRVVTSVADVRERLMNVVGGRAEIKELYEANPVRMNTLPGFETMVASYATDVPHFSALEATCFLFGPGTIIRAHTDHEHVYVSELEEAVQGYCTIYDRLQ